MIVFSNPGTILIILTKFLNQPSTDPLSDKKMQHVNGWNFIQCIYFVTCTLTSVGYGDLVPRDGISKVVCCIYTLAGVALTSLLVGSTIEVLMDRIRQAQRQQFENASLRREMLKMMDKDGDGKIDKVEYIDFMLRETGLVAGEILDELHRTYEEHSIILEFRLNFPSKPYTG